MNGLEFLLGMSMVPLGQLEIPDWLNVCSNDDKEGLNHV